MFELIRTLKNKSRLLQVIDRLPISIFKHFQFKYFLKELENDFERMKFIDNIISKDLDNYSFINIIESLEIDKNKIKYFKFLPKYSQVRIIKQFTDLEIKKECTLNSIYSEYRSELVASIEDEQFIIEIFDKIDVKKFRHNLITKIDDIKLKEKLIVRLGDKSLLDFIESFKIQSKEISIDNDIDSKITIGVELETCHKDIDSLLLLKEMPHKYRIMRDGSVLNGFEIVSPILHHTKEDMNNLNNICDILKYNSFYTDFSCGGHIHLGADYLENIDEYKMFLHLYCNFEDIIYLICNRQHSKGRASIVKFAQKTKEKYIMAEKAGLFDGDYESIEDFKEKIIELNENRYKGLNVYNLRKNRINTFEFRMANGEIEFNELYYNIKLYTRLLQVSKELANIKEDDPRYEYLEVLNKPLKQKDKLNLLLALLFKNETDRNIYRERYNKNISVLNSIYSEIKRDKVVKIVKPKNLVLKK